MIRIDRGEELKKKYEDIAIVFKALCDSNRLIIIEMLKNDEKCACKLLEDLNIAQSTLSHHMKILCDSGFVDSRRDGKWMKYSLNKQGFEAAKSLLVDFTTDITNEEIK